MDRHHIHDENCGCGEHGHVCDHGEPEYGAVKIERRRHDEAVVISGSLAVRGDYAALRAVLEDQMSRMAEEITALGGIIGHIKASCAVTSVEMYSITDENAGLAVKTPPEQEVRINLAAIVFAIPEEEAEKLVAAALRKVRGACVG